MFILGNAKRKSTPVRLRLKERKTYVPSQTWGTISSASFHSEGKGFTSMPFSIVFTPVTEDCLSLKFVLKMKDHGSERRVG